LLPKANEEFDFSSVTEEENSIPETIECQLCLDDFPSKDCFVTTCKDDDGKNIHHGYDAECIKKMFEVACNDPSEMPPKCCQNEIALPKLPENMQKMFDIGFRKKFLRKYAEFVHTQESVTVYCPNTKCISPKGGANWIRPKYHVDDPTTNRKKGICSKCSTQVCVPCKQAWHGQDKCTVDPAAQIVKEAFEGDKNLAQCPSCGLLVYRYSGCNHLTCRCEYQFCLKCLSRWEPYNGWCKNGCKLFDDAPENPAPDFNPGEINGDFVNEFAFQRLFGGHGGQQAVMNRWQEEQDDDSDFDWEAWQDGEDNRLRRQWDDDSDNGRVFVQDNRAFEPFSGHGNPTIYRWPLDKELMRNTDLGYRHEQHFERSQHSLGVTAADRWGFDPNINHEESVSTLHPLLFV
jgi:hypothetical protein